MNVSLHTAPWYKAAPTPELQEACDVLGDGVWREAAVNFYAERSARIKRGLKAPKGIQSFLNRTIGERFEAVRLHVKESLSQVAILAGESGFLRLVTPNDAAALISFEKLRVAVAELNGVVTIPLIIGALSPKSDLPPEIALELGRARSRDKSVPLFD
jgi:hypothetical protein